MDRPRQGRHKACVDGAVKATACSPEVKLAFKRGAVNTKHVRAGQSLLFPRLKMLPLLWQWQGSVTEFVLPWKPEAHHCLSNSHSALTHLPTILHSLFEKVSISTLMCQALCSVLGYKSKNTLIYTSGKTRRQRLIHLYQHHCSGFATVP